MKDMWEIIMKCNKLGKLILGDEEIDVVVTDMRRKLHEINVYADCFDKKHEEINIYLEVALCGEGFHKIITTPKVARKNTQTS